MKTTVCASTSTAVSDACVALGLDLDLERSTGWCPGQADRWERWARRLSLLAFNEVDPWSRSRAEVEVMVPERSTGEVSKTMWGPTGPTPRSWSRAAGDRAPIVK